MPQAPAKPPRAVPCQLPWRWRGRLQGRRKAKKTLKLLQLAFRSRNEEADPDMEAITAGVSVLGIRTRGEFEGDYSTCLRMA